MSSQIGRGPHLFDPLGSQRRYMGAIWSDPTAPTVLPGVISGENVGVRVTGPSDKSGKVVGTLVVKINGQWVDVTSSMTGVPMTR